MVIFQQHSSNSVCDQKTDHKINIFKIIFLLVDEITGSLALM